MGKTKLYNLIVLDESGSMESIKNSTITGFNEIVQTIKNAEQKYPEQEHYVTLVTFNSNGIKTKLDGARAKDLKKIDAKVFKPDASTPLYDAIGLSVVKLRNEINAKDDVTVLVTVLTDGEENASKEYSGKQLKQIIEDQKRKGWTFVYIGANHDVEATASNLSINNFTRFEANDLDVNKTFKREVVARMNYYDAVHENTTLNTNFFKDETVKPIKKKPVAIPIFKELKNKFNLNVDDDSAS